MHSETSWGNTFNNAAPELKMHLDASLTIGLLVAAVLVALAIGIAAHTYLKGRGQQVSLRGTASHLFGLVWLFPIAAVALLAILVVVFPSRVEVKPEQAIPDNGAELGEPMEVIDTVTDGSADLVVVPNDDERPEWVNETHVDIDGRQLMTVQSQQFAEKHRARQDALDEAVAIIRKDFEHTQRAEDTNWTLSPALVREVAVKDTWIEPIQRTTGVNEFSVYRVYHQVELSPQVREVVYQSWRSQVVESRVWVLGGLLGFLTLLIGTAATYLRLDTLTGGNYRRRLKLASVSLVAAGGLGLAVLLPLT